MRAMIMAAGLGTRLRPLTGLIPKPMAPLANRPALYHIVELLKRHGITEVVINIHYFPDTLTSYLGDGYDLGMSIRFAYEEELLGTAGGVKNNEDFLGGDTFIVMSGDALTDLDLEAAVRTHREKGGIATLSVKEVEDPSDYGVMIVDENDRITGFQEKPAPEEALSNLSNAGIYIFEPEIFKRIPADTFYDFGNQVLPGLVKEDIPFYVHRIESYWNDVGSLSEYRQGNFDALEGKVQLEPEGTEVAPGVRAGERTYISPEATVEGPVLLGPRLPGGGRRRPAGTPGRRGLLRDRDRSPARVERVVGRCARRSPRADPGQHRGLAHLGVAGGPGGGFGRGRTLRPIGGRSG